MRMEYKAEGAATGVINAETLERAYYTGEILSARATMCDNSRNLKVDLGFAEGIIPRAETAIGMDGAGTRDIAVISRVGHLVCFKVIDISGLRDKLPKIILSRRRAQQEALEYLIATLRPGDIMPARVTRLENFGAFVDIGCGVISLIGIENISVSRISHPRDRFFTGQDIYVLVCATDKNAQRITLSHRELLGTWEQNAAQFSAGDTVEGIARGIEPYGIFVELRPNLTGLTDFYNDIKEGKRLTVYIKSIVPERMKIKLALIEAHADFAPLAPLKYFTSSGSLRSWQYSPDCCPRVIGSSY